MEQLYSDIDQIVNESIIAVAEQNDALQCSAGYWQRIMVLIEKSDLEISGNFIVRQKAKYAVHCMQSSNTSATLQREVKNTIAKRIETELAKHSVSVPPAELRDIIDPRITESFQGCVQKEASNQVRESLLVAPSHVIYGSKILVGCSEPKVERLRKDCTIQIAELTAAALQNQNNTKFQRNNNKKDPCLELVDCAKKEGNFTITTLAQLGDECTVYTDIARQVVEKVAERYFEQDREKPKTDETDEEEKDMKWMFWFVIVSVSLLLIILVVIAAYLLRSKGTQNRLITW